MIRRPPSPYYVDGCTYRFFFQLIYCRTALAARHSLTVHVRDVLLSGERNCVVLWLWEDRRDTPKSSRLGEPMTSTLHVEKWSGIELVITRQDGEPQSWYEYVSDGYTHSGLTRYLMFC